MLMLRRRVGERIVIAGGIEIIVSEAGPRGVRIGVVAPRGVLVLRGEVHDAVTAANEAAAQMAPVPRANVDRTGNEEEAR